MFCGSLQARAAWYPLERQFLLRLQEKALLYFIEQYENGVYRDKASNRIDAPTIPLPHWGSMATSGYGMAILAHAASRGYLPMSFARNRAFESLEMAWNAPHYHGWLAHFVTSSTVPEIVVDSEYSTIDTALFLYGAFYAASLLKDDRLNEWVQKIADRLDWKTMLTNGGRYPKKMTLSMGFRNGTFEAGEWDKFSETPILLLLGIGLGKLPVETWWSWRRQFVESPDGPILGGDESLFIHHFLPLYLGNTEIEDGFPSIFHNSVRAVQYNARFSSLFPKLYFNLWGISAAPRPSTSGLDAGYFAYGPSTEAHDGTVTLSTSISSLPFAPSLVLRSIQHWTHPLSPYRTDLVGRYGFFESINLSKNYRCPYVIGLSLATVYQAIANWIEPQSFPSTFVQIPFVSHALQRIKEAAPQFESLKESLLVPVRVYRN